MQVLVGKVSVGFLGPNANGVLGNKLTETSAMIFTHLLRKYTKVMMRKN